MLVGGGVGSAQATQGAAPGSCPSLNVCLWYGVSYSSYLTVHKGTGYWNIPSGPQDEISSWANKTGSTQCLYDFYEGVTYVLDVLPNNKGETYLGDDYNDRADATNKC